MRPVPTAPETAADLTPVLQEMADAVGAIQTPIQPSPLWSVTFAKLPPAASWTGCLVWVTDKNKVGVSNGTAWTQTDGGAL